jgi:tRNA uridine 5-carboxymethylaminomethyl modification enzyme
MEGLKATPPELNRIGIQVRQDGKIRTAAEVLALPETSVAILSRLWPDLQEIPEDIILQIETDAHYAAYLSRQEADIRAYRKDEALLLPGDIDFTSVGGLSNEMISRLCQAQPRTLGQAARLPGITPAAVVALMRYLRKMDGPRTRSHGTEAA